MIRVFPAVLLPLILGGCATTLPPEVTAFRSPVDIANGVRKLHHHSVITSYTHREPVDPKPWRQLNDERAPLPEESAAPAKPKVEKP
jgi:hypothetical protein